MEIKLAFNHFADAQVCLFVANKKNLNIVREKHNGVYQIGMFFIFALDYLWSN